MHRYGTGTQIKQKQYKKQTELSVSTDLAHW